MKVLAESNIDSAYAALQFEEDGFVGQFAEALGGEDTARVLYAKAQQMQTTAFHAATNFLMAKTGAGIYAVPPTLRTPAADTVGAVGAAAAPAPAPAVGAAPAAAAADGDEVIAYATLETLFGELDYCSCEHCRSVLSPAAYLVDLLKFCDKRLFNAAGQELPKTYAKSNPLDVLLARRPDIAELKLTCENTNVALPYVDLVNEVLEHFVVNKSLAGFKGHDVDPDQTSAELLASPQFVDPAAYATLAGESFPLTLPFHRPLAALRAYLERADVSLAEAMEGARRSDAMAAGGAAYGWRDILIERLGVSRAEYRLLTDAGVALTELYGDDLPNDAAALDAITNAKALARRLDVGYEQLVDLTRTRFVNPASWLLGRLERLRVSLKTIEDHHDGTISDAEFDARLPADIDTAPYGGSPRAWLAQHYDEIGSLLVLVDPDGDDICSFDKIELRHALSGSPLTALEALHVLRFVRLWRRLGWTMEQTDEALTALWPPAQRPLPADDDASARGKLDSGCAEVLLRLAHLGAVMRRLGLRPDRDLSSALALWGPIGTAGRGSLYHRLFLASSSVAIGPEFAEDAAGEVLTDATKTLVGSAPALAAAFKLKEDELDDILGIAGFGAATVLDIDNVSTVFRWAFLARTLRISARELGALAAMTALNPFAAPTSPRPALGEFLEKVDRLDDAGIKPALLMYLLRHDLPRGAPDPSELLSLAKALHDDLARIEQENVLVEDPAGELTRAKMALVYDQATADTFLALVTGTATFDVPYAQLGPALDPAVVAAAPGLAYDHLRKRLIHTGLLSQAQRDAVLGLAGVTPALTTAVGALFTAGAESTAEFFQRYPELGTLYDAVMAAPAAQRTASLLGHFLPDLRRRLQELHLLQALAVDADMTPADVGRLVRDSAVLHAVADATRPALADLMALGRRGASMTIYDGADTTGVPSTVADAVEALDYGAANPLPANSTNAAGKVSGVWRWRADPPVNGFYNLTIEADAGATVALQIDGEDVALAAAGSTWESQQPIELKAGQLPEMRLTVKNVRIGMAVRWQSAGLALEVIPAERMLPAELVDRFAAGYTRLLKTFAIAQAFALDGEELAWFAIRPGLAVGGSGWLNAVPVAAGAPAAALPGLFAAVLQLAGYAQLRRDLKAGEHRLLDLLRDPAKQTDAGTSMRAQVTGWPDEAVATVLGHLGIAEADLADLDRLRRVKLVIDLARRIGVPVKTLTADLTNDPTEAQVADLQSALRAAYDETAWGEVVQPVNDALRDQQRDALVAYVLHWLRAHEPAKNIDTVDKLYEWFLIDVEMEPCMQTSRMRLALSTRCSSSSSAACSTSSRRWPPSSISAAQWTWMRAIASGRRTERCSFTPRTGSSPSCATTSRRCSSELEADLLGADITQEAAARAFGRYLERLTEVAKLEVAGVAVEEYATGARRRHRPPGRTDGGRPAQVLLPTPAAQQLDRVGGDPARHRGHPGHPRRLEAGAASSSG